MILSKLTQLLKPADVENKGKLSGYLRNLDTDIKNLFLAMATRLRFGAVTTDGAQGENIAGEVQIYTSNATPDTEDTIAHTVGAIPLGIIVMGQDKAGHTYQVAGTGTAWTSTSIFLKSDVASVTFTLFLLK